MDAASLVKDLTFSYTACDQAARFIHLPEKFCLWIKQFCICVSNREIKSV